LALVLIGIAGFTLAAWVVSVMLFPMFVPRYFTPQLIVGFALHVAFCEWLVRLVIHRLQATKNLQARRRDLATCAVIIPPALLSVVMLCRDPARERAPCTNDIGARFESDFVRGDLPVIAESPQVFLPRVTYASHGTAYRFPLDWEVVLKYPTRNRGNAVDFHMMKSLQTWAPMPSIMSTEAIVRGFPQFLAIEQSGRAWFHNLRKTRDIVAEKLAEVTSPDGDQTCTLWKVTSVKPRL
jgi:hypothetical protein